MPDSGEYNPQRLRGFVRGVNWRPTRLEEDVSHYLICRLCQVLPRNKVLLPCQHALCESCFDRTLQDGRGVCPCDGEIFEEDECQKISMCARKAENLKAHCWNELQGCAFVGTLQSVLQHYDEECGFHVVSCPRCDDSVLNVDLPAHYADVCCHAQSSAAVDQHPQERGAATPRRFLAELSGGIKTPLRNPYDDQLPVLETRVNELTEQATVHEAKLQEMTVAFVGAMNTLKAELEHLLGKFSASLSEAIQSLQRTHACAVLEETSVREGGAEASAPSVPWRMEKKSILRNLEFMVSGALRSLEGIRECAVIRLEYPDKQVMLPSFILEEQPGSITESDLLEGTGNKGFRCGLTLVNPHKLGQFEKYTRSLSAVFRAWHSRDLSFAVTVTREREKVWSFKLMFTWADGCGTYSPMPHVAAVKMKSDRTENDLNLLELKKDASLAPFSGCMQIFHVDRVWWNYATDNRLFFEIEIVQ